MSVDTIANMLSQIKNASLVGKEYVELPYSKVAEAVLKVFEEYKYIKKVKTFKQKGISYKSLHIDLAYDNKGKSVIRDIKRVSKPGRRLYWKAGEIKITKPRYGFYVMSTSKGIMSNIAAAKKNLGGEVICEVI